MLAPKLFDPLLQFPYLDLTATAHTDTTTTIFPLPIFGEGIHHQRSQAFHHLMFLLEKAAGLVVPTPLCSWASAFIETVV